MWVNSQLRHLLWIDLEDLSLPPEERRSEDAFTGGRTGESGGEISPDSPLPTKWGRLASVIQKDREPKNWGTQCMNHSNFAAWEASFFTPTVGIFRSSAGTDGAVCEQLLLDAPRELFVIVPRLCVETGVGTFLGDNEDYMPCLSTMPCCSPKNIKKRMAYVCSIWLGEQPVHEDGVEFHFAREAPPELHRGDLDGATCRVGRIIMIMWLI